MAIGYGKYIIVDRETRERITYKKYREAENKLQELNRISAKNTHAQGHVRKSQAQ